MELATSSFVKIEGGTIEVKANCVAEAKLALKEMKLKKKEFGLMKRSVSDRQKEIRAAYTQEVRNRGSMMRGAGGLGKFVRTIQTISRDSKGAQLAATLAPLEEEKQRIGALMRAIDSAILQVEVHVLNHA